MAGSIQFREERPSPWRARYVGADGREHSKSFRRKVDADRWLRSELAALDRGIWIDPMAGAVRFSDWYQSWLLGLAYLKPKTEASYQEVGRNLVLPRFGDTEIRHITPESVREWIKDLADRGLSSSRIRQARGLLKASLEVAVVDGRLAKNPVANIKAPTARTREQRFLTATQVVLLAEAAEQVRAGAGLLVETLAWSGIRWGEAVALRQRALDPLRRRLSIREAATEVGGQLVFGSPKSHRSREVVIPRDLAERLAYTFIKDQPDALVFTSPSGQALRGSNWRRRVFRPALAASGIDQDLRPHDLRHTAASLMISEGATVKTVQRQLGHASAAMTLDVYAGLFADDLETLGVNLDRAHERAVSEAVSAHSRPKPAADLTAMSRHQQENKA